MIDDPIRAQSNSLIAGGILAAVAVAGCAIVALVRPQEELGTAAIVMGRDSGALYVRVGDTLHPVLNLASARLIAAAKENPRPVSESELAKAKRGPLLGIPGAPQFIAEPQAPEESSWTVCDTTGTPPAPPMSTTVIVGPVRGGAPDQTVLVTPTNGATPYLLYNGLRAAVDLTDPATVGALRLDGVVPRPVSSTLLSAIPEAPPIVAPRIPGAGGPSALNGFPVGSVVRMPRAEAQEYYVVLAGGVQQIGQVTADLIRSADSQGNRDIVAVAPDAIRDIPKFDSVPVSSYPDRVAAPQGVADEPVLCVNWMPAGSRTSFLAGEGLPLDADQTPVTLAQADDDGPALDAVFVPPGRSGYVRATSLTGDDGREETRYLVADTGVRFAIQDTDAAQSLGLAGNPTPAPWPVLAALPPGPELGRANALVAHDTLTTGSISVPLSPGPP